jgi:hypothetical protein
LNSLFDNIINYNKQSFNSINITDTKFTFSFKPIYGENHRKEYFTNIPIDPSKGITNPFIQSDRRSIRDFLLNTNNFEIKIDSIALQNE